MRYWLIVLYCFSIVSGFADEEDLPEELILSTPDQLSTLTCEPSYLIGGLISPMAGHVSLKRTDLVVKGAQNITLTRIYIPPYLPCSFPKYKDNQEEYNKKHLYYLLHENYKGWQFFPHLRLQYYPRLKEIRLSEPNGATLNFRISGSKFTLVAPHYAISNAAGDEPSGKYDARNTRISYEANGNKIAVYATDGTVRFYDKKGISTKNSYLFLLQKEILSNGKILKYYYNEKNQLACVKSLDPQELYVYSSLQVSGSPMEGSCHFTSSSGLTADYVYQKRPLHWKIKKKHYKEEFNSFSLRCPPKFRHWNKKYLTAKILPKNKGNYGKTSQIYRSL